MSDDMNHNCTNGAYACAEQPQNEPHDPSKSRYLAIAYSRDGDFAFSLPLTLDASTLGDCPSNRCAAALLAFQHLCRHFPGYPVIDRIWLIHQDAVIGDWRAGEHFESERTEKIATANSKSVAH